MVDPVMAATRVTGEVPFETPDGATTPRRMPGSLRKRRIGRCLAYEVKASSGTEKRPAALADRCGFPFNQGWRYRPKAGKIDGNVPKVITRPL